MDPRKWGAECRWRKSDFKDFKAAAATSTTAIRTTWRLYHHRHSTPHFLGSITQCLEPSEMAPRPVENLSDIESADDEDPRNPESLQEKCCRAILGPSLSELCRCSDIR